MKEFQYQLHLLHPHLRHRLQKQQIVLAMIHQQLLQYFLVRLEKQSLVN
jgi:hypothetical protein